MLPGPAQPLGPCWSRSRSCLTASRGQRGPGRNAPGSATSRSLDPPSLHLLASVLGAREHVASFFNEFAQLLNGIDRVCVADVAATSSMSFHVPAHVLHDGDVLCHFRLLARKLVSPTRFTLP